MLNKAKLAYISFDTVPAPKGAAVHIAAFTKVLASAFGQIQLVTVSPTSQVINPVEIFPNVIQTQLPAVGDTVINRVLYFRTFLGSWWPNVKFEAVHIRSIYEGFPIALNKQRLCDRLIFEVNGLPSIELKYRYPAIADDRELLYKLKAQEKICLDAADLIITPSRVTYNYLQTRGISSTKIRVIPNGVDLNIFTLPPVPLLPSLPFQMLYFGTLSAWQGVNIAIEALALICREFPAKLTVIGQIRDFAKANNFASRQVQKFKQLAIKLGVTEQLTIIEPLPQMELVKQIHAAHAIVAPLTPNDRNMVQGCCPLKILESMATGTPVIASDLPVVREIGTDGVHLLLVKPGSAKAIKDAVVRLQTETGLRTKLTTNARQQIEQSYTWLQAGDALVQAYQELGIKRLIKT